MSANAATRMLCSLIMQLLQLLHNAWHRRSPKSSATGGRGSKGGHAIA